MSVESDTKAGIGKDLYDFRLGESETKAIDLVELTIWPPRQGEREKQFPLWIDLRFDDQILPDTGDWRVTVYLTGAELFAELEGCTFAPGTLYGDVPLPAAEIVSEKKTHESDVSATGQASTKIAAGILEGLSLGANAEASGKAQTRTKVAHEHNAEIVHRRVVSRPNGRWEVLESRGPLDGTYLRIPSQDEAVHSRSESAPLCMLTVEKDNFSVILTLKANPEYINPDITPLTKASRYLWNKAAKGRPNKAAIIKRLIAMSCTKRFRRAGDSRVPLARAVLTGSRRIDIVEISK